MSEEALEQITELRREIEEERERHETAMHGLMVRLVTVERSLLPEYSPVEEASIIEDHIRQML